MTQERAKEILPLIQAVAEGKILQYHDENGWRDRTDLLFTSPIECYRIKPEPREWTIKFFANRTATWEGPLPVWCDPIRVREIIEEP